MTNMLSQFMQKSALLIIFFLCTFLVEIKAQTGTFQSFNEFKIGVTCPCELVSSSRIKRMAEFAGTTAPVLGYECNVGDGDDAVRYSLTITNLRKKYSEMPLAIYTKSVEKELERLTINFAKSGSLVRWTRVEGVYGVHTISQFETIATQTIFIIKEGVQYELQVQGRGNYYDEFIDFVDSLRTL